MSRSPIAHCHFMLHFYERINDDDDDDDDGMDPNIDVPFCQKASACCTHMYAQGIVV